MIAPKTFWTTLERRGFRFLSGVPCSILEPALAALPQHPGIHYVPAVREDVALGIASGAWFAGQRSAVLMQNSGLGNVVNPLTSFSLMYHVPVLLIITWRGYQGKDAPEHLIMGDKTPDFLTVMGVPYVVLDETNLEDALDRAVRFMDAEKKPFALILKKGTVG